MNVSTLVAGSLWLVTLWRLPSIRHSHKQRSLAYTFAALAAAMTFEVPTVKALVDDHVGLTGVPALLKHLLGVTSAACLLDFVIAVIRPQGLGRRIRTAAIAATLPLMVLFYALANWMPGGPVRVGDGATAVYPVLYTAAFTLYIGVAMVVATWLFLGSVRHSRTLLGKAGLGFLGLGTLLGSLYAAQRVVFVTLQLTTGADHPALQDTISTTLKQTAILSIVIGSCLPPLSVAVEWAKDWAALKALQPLWRGLTSPVSHVVLPSSIPTHRTHLRLDRCVTEIDDACLALREYVTAELQEQARKFAAQKGFESSRVDVVSEACWLAVATHAARNGKQLQGVEYPTLGVTGKDRPSELEWLRAVSRAYRLSPAVKEFARQTIGPDKDTPHDSH